MFLAAIFAVNTISSYSPNLGGRTYFFNDYNVLFLMNLHSPSKSNTNSNLPKLLAAFWYVCLWRLDI